MHLLALVEEQQEAIKKLTELAGPQSPSRTLKSHNIMLRVQIRCHVQGV